MKKFLLIKMSYALAVAFGLMLFCLPQPNLSAQASPECPSDLNLLALPFFTPDSCDNMGTTDPSDDQVCFDEYNFIPFGGLPDSPFSFSAGGVAIPGTFTIADVDPATSRIPLGGVFCFPSNADPLVFTVTFDDGCVLTNSQPNDGSLVCSDCADANGNGICDDVDVADADGDGVPDDMDVCDGGDDNEDEDGDGVPDFCDVCPTMANVMPGDACPSDGDDCTDDGVVSATCECTSVLIDSDGDGVCDLDDICEGFDDAADSDGDGVPDGCDVCPDLANMSPGDACPSDGDDCTDDGVLSATCECTSTPIDSPECNPTGGCDVCDSAGWDTNFEFIKKVGFGYIWNNSGDNGGYADFTDTPLDFNCGYEYSLTLKPGFNHYAFLEHWNVWIDWNQDCDFDDADEFVGQAVHHGTVYGWLTVPDHALTGNTTMRISMKYEDHAESCENFTYGEVEDYTLNIICGHAPVSTNEIALLEEANQEHIENEQAEAMHRPPYIGTKADRLSQAHLAKDLNADEVLVYPNPARDIVNISVNTEIENGTLTIYDSVGRTIRQVAINGDSPVVTLDINEYAAGIYSVSIEGDSFNSLVKQFVVTK